MRMLCVDSLMYDPVGYKNVVHSLVTAIVRWCNIDFSQFIWIVAVLYNTILSSYTHTYRGCPAGYQSRNFPCSIRFYPIFTHYILYYIVYCMYCVLYNLRGT